MKKYLVIGNPIEHSLSPKLHNYWFNLYNIDSLYKKKEVQETDLEKIISQVKENKISGINVTVPFKKTIIKYLDTLSEVAKKTQSVNTIFMRKNKIYGDNTDCKGFERSLIETGFNTIGKTAFIIGAGGVTSSIILALEISGVKKIYISNRTKQKVEEIKKIFPKIEIIEWGKKPSQFDIVINTTSVGLKEKDEIEIDFTGCNNKLFYDLIYSMKTKFLKNREKTNYTKDGIAMFAYQAQEAFECWEGFKPNIDEKLWEILKN